MGIPKYQSLPKFSDDPTQNAEMQMEYISDCRMQGIDPYYAGDTDDDYPDDYDHDAYDHEDDEEFDNDE